MSAVETKTNELKYVVVGSGFYGAVIAERIAQDLGEKVLILEQRKHTGGNSHSQIDENTGIEFHTYGSHIFHTNSETVWRYINRFTRFNSYRHRVLTQFKGRVFPMPINLMTINQYYGLNLSPEEAKAFLSAEISRDKISSPKNLEEQAISLIGRPLYEAFVKGYTQKQWETELTSLPANIITRLPVRFNYDDRYFSDKYEGIPLDGYAKVFDSMLSHPNIEIQLGVDYFNLKPHLPNGITTIYTGPIDRYFDYKLGTLGWRTIDLERSVESMADYQGTAVMNYAEAAVPFTRIHEFKHFHPERKLASEKTLIFREFSRFARKGELPYYPINTDEDKKLYKEYQKLASQEANVIFGGRLGSYKYFDMHQAIGAALLTYERDIKPKATGVPYKSPTEIQNQLSEYA